MADHNSPTSCNDQTLVVGGANVMSAISGREQDRLMPVANVIRMMRKVLPLHAKIADDAKETIQECVSEFISFITSEANDRCHSEQRRTITADDIIYAMCKLGFDDYIKPLSRYRDRYREMEGGDHRYCSSKRSEFLPILKKDPHVATMCTRRPSPSIKRRGIYGKGAFEYAHLFKEYEHNDRSTCNITLPLDSFNDHHHNI